MSLYHCDCCNAPMVAATNYRADSCSAGCDTSACVLCAGGFSGPTADDITEEIVALGPYMDEPRVRDRIIVLGNALGKREAA